MRPEDRAEMSRRLNQELLLFRSGFEPVLPDGRELFTRTGAEHPELYTRGRALVVALAELAAGERATRERS